MRDLLRYILIYVYKRQNCTRTFVSPFTPYQLGLVINSIRDKTTYPSVPRATTTINTKLYLDQLIQFNYDYFYTIVFFFDRVNLTHFHYIYSSEFKIKYSPFP